ncbi:Txe/YoeB family addiction module toxin [Phormidium tenue]|jgi:Txe/YoeB family toxin of Txe-Axe toxin-antitoxin module
MTIIFSDDAWEDYLYWQRTDPKILKRINTLIKEIQRTPYEGIGKPEDLKHGFRDIGQDVLLTSIALFTKRKLILC